MVDRREARIEGLEANLDRLAARVERRLDALPTRRFTLLLAATSSAANVTVIVLAVIYATARGH